MPSTPGVYVELAQLVELREQARGLTLRPQQAASNLLAGRHHSRQRGRGLSFEELRPYWPGDDARLIDWKVTARLRRPFLRLFSEERDRPVLLLVDQRMNQFFGSRHVLKSVLAAEVATLLGWAALEQQDRVGAILFGDTTTLELRPARGSHAFLRLLAELEGFNHALHAGNRHNDPARLNAVLAQAARLAGKDHLLILISDFHGLDEQTRLQLADLRRHNDLLAFWTQDPVLSAPPSGGLLVVSDGAQQMPLDLDQAAVKERLQQLRSARERDILGLRDNPGMPLLTLSTAEAAAPQLRRLLQQATRERRRG